MSADYFAVLRLNSSVRVNAKYTPKQKNMLWIYQCVALPGIESSVRSSWSFQASGLSFGCPVIQQENSRYVRAFL
jgi:hypothetical protein